MPTLTLAFKNNTLQVIPLRDDLLTIGREPSSDIFIDSLAVAPQHARLVRRDGQYTLQNHNDEEVFVNHQQVNEHTLQNDDLIRIGKHTLRYASVGEALAETRPATLEKPVTATATSEVASTAPPSNNTGKDGWLQVLSGSHLGKTIKLRSGMTDLGKIGITPALISLRRDGYFIANLGENDNLCVGENNIGDKTWPLNDGDLIQIDKLKLQFHLQS